MTFIPPIHTVLHIRDELRHAFNVKTKDSVEDVALTNRY